MAVKWQYIDSNPGNRVEAPKLGHKEAKHYQDYEVIDMLNKLQTAPIKYQCAIYIAVFAGARLGEVNALKWSDIDFDKHTISVSKQLLYIKGQGCK